MKMWEKNYTADNVHEFFEEVDKLNSNTAKYIIWAAYRDMRKDTEERGFIENFYQINGYYVNCSKVTDNIFVVSRHKYGYKDTGEVYFSVVKESNGVFYYGHHAWDSFDKAILGAMSYIYTEDEDAAEYMWKLLD